MQFGRCGQRSSRVMRILLLLWTILPTGLWAQENDQRHSIQLGLSVTTFLENSVSGIGSHAEYSHRLGPGSAVVGRIMGAGGVARFGSGSYGSRSIGGSLASRFIPFHGAFPYLTFDLGVVYNRITDRVQPATDLTAPDAIGRTSSRNAIGLCGALAMALIRSDRMDTGIRADLLTSFVDTELNTDMVQAGIYMGIRF